MVNDQGGSYVGAVSFGIKSFEDLCHIIKYHINQTAEELHTRAMEKINDKAEG